MTIVELFAHIGFKADNAQADRFLKQVNGLKTALIGSSLSAAGFVLAVRKITSDSMMAALEIKKLQDSTGASAESLQRWQAVADQVSGSGQAVAASIRAIASNQEKIKLGGGNISAFQMLGIDPRSDPFAVLEQLRTKTQGLSQAMKRNIMEQMGVSGDLISTLELTNEQFSAMAKQAWIIPQSQIDGLNKARSSLVEVGQAIKYMKALIATQLAPKILEITKRSLEWVRANKEGLVKSISRIFDLISRFIVAIFRAGSMINSLVTNTIGWKAALLGIVGVLAIMNAAFLTSPLGLFIAGIVLLVAVLDDLYVYSKGGNSLFGNMLDKFPALKGIMGGFKEFGSAIKAIFNNDWTKFDAMLDKWGLLGDIIKAIVDGIKWIIEAPGKIKEVLDTFNAPDNEKNKRLNQAMGASASSQGLAAAYGYNTNTSVNVNVYGSSDAEATGKVAAREVQRVMQGTKIQRSPGNKGMK